MPAGGARAAFYHPLMGSAVAVVAMDTRSWSGTRTPEEEAETRSVSGTAPVKNVSVEYWNLLVVVVNLRLSS